MIGTCASDFLNPSLSLRLMSLLASYESVFLATLLLLTLFICREYYSLDQEFLQIDPLVPPFLAGADAAPSAGVMLLACK